MDRIQQNKMTLVFDKKTVDWLVNNTKVKTFDPIAFTGYQRKININQRNKIIEYIKNNEFFFPTSIICSCDGEYSKDKTLYVVDGQHRIAAFAELAKGYENSLVYEQIKNNEIPVIIMVNPNPQTEVETFITINKTAKKVDTSLAIVLRSTFNFPNDKILPRIQYLAVQAAWELSFGDESNEETKYLWGNEIAFEKYPGDESLISLNAFVRSFGLIISQMIKYGFITGKWDTNCEYTKQLEYILLFINTVWSTISNEKWPELFTSDKQLRKIIQGPIGFSSINKYLILRMQNDSQVNKENLNVKAKEWIKDINVGYAEWMPGNTFSKFSSEAGYSFIANTIAANKF
jgi:DGQHR domain-containing protein